jgi:hypothetical protein
VGAFGEIYICGEMLISVQAAIFEGPRSGVRSCSSGRHGVELCNNIVIWVPLSCKMLHFIAAKIVNSLSFDVGMEKKETTLVTPGLVVSALWLAYPMHEISAKAHNLRPHQRSLYFNNSFKLSLFIMAIPALVHSQT